jgi:hypothetical protein
MSTDPRDSDSTSDVRPAPGSRNDLVAFAIASLHVRGILYVLVGALISWLDVAPEKNALYHRRFWAWVAGLVVFGIYTPSLFFPLGVLGLWGLLARRSRIEFGMGVTASGEDHSEKHGN